MLCSALLWQKEAIDKSEISCKRAKAYITLKVTLTNVYIGLGHIKVQVSHHLWILQEERLGYRGNSREMPQVDEADGELDPEVDGKTHGDDHGHFTQVIAVGKKKIGS